MIHAGPRVRTPSPSLCLPHAVIRGRIANSLSISVPSLMGIAEQARSRVGAGRPTLTNVITPSL